MLGIKKLRVLPVKSCLIQFLMQKKFQILDKKTKLKNSYFLLMLSDTILIKVDIQI